MRCALLSIGDEVLQGRIVDTNAPWIARQLDDLGIATVHMETVSDARADIEAALLRCCALSDLVLATGGLGPTDDDRTREALFALVDEPIERDADALAALTMRLERAGVDVSEAQCRQADRPAPMRSVPNATGTAPGITGTLQGATLWLLPGPPDECKPMVNAHVLPELAHHTGADHQHLVTAFGLAEAPVAALLGDRLREGHDPVTGIRVSDGLLHVHLRSADQGLLAREAALIRDRIGVCALPDGCPSPAEAVADLLLDRGWTVATAESCTAGLIGAALTHRPGSSAWYAGGLQTYADSAKLELLNVPQSLLANEGAVSAAVVEAMARGAAAALHTHTAVAVTGIAGPDGGIAGPDGGTPDKPVGTVWIGTSVEGDVRSRCVRLPGPRQRVRHWSVHAALQSLRWHVEGVNGAMRWDVRQ